MTDTKSFEALAAVAASWAEGGIRYAILHGVERLPRLGRDVDVLVRATDSGRAIELAASVLEGEGFRVAYPPAIWGPRLLATREPGWLNCVELHLTSEVRWRGARFADDPTIDGRVGPFEWDAWASFAKVVMLPLLGRNDARAEKISSWLEVARAVDPSLARIHAGCREWFGDDADRLLKAAIGCRTDELVALAPRLRTSAVRSALRNDASGFVSGYVEGFLRRLRLPLVPAAPIVAVVGPDGVGKTTLLQSMEAGDPSVFTSVVTRHWRPGLLPDLKDLVRLRFKTAPSDVPVPPRRSAGRGSLIRLIYYLLDFLLGWLLRDRPASARQQLVLYDRHLLDMWADPARYGMRLSERSMWLRRLVPAPDLVVALTLDPQTTYLRKPELTIDEIEAQFAYWRRMRDLGEVDVSLSAEEPPDELKEKLEAIIMDALFSLHDGDRARVEGLQGVNGS